MTVFSHTTGFTRGEVESSLYDRFDVDFYRAASKLIDNWFPDVTGALERRPAFKATGKNAPFLVQAYPPEIPSGSDCGEFHMRTFAFRGITFLLLFRRVCEAGYETITVSCYRYLNDNSLDPQFDDEYLVYYSNASTDLATALTNAGKDLPPDSFDGNVPSQFIDNLARNICIAQVGPAVFVTSPLFPPYRVFVDTNNEANIEIVQFYQELFGTVEIGQDKKEWVGTDTLFEDQLAPGETFFFRGEEYTVDSINSQTKLFSDQKYTGVSVAGERIQKRTNYFDTDWPRLCTFYKGRLMLFSSRLKPVGMWASKSNDPFTMIPGSTYDDAPIELELFTEGAESFRWVDSGAKVLLGGEQAEYIVDTIADSPLTPTSFSFYRVSNNGGTSLQPFSTNATTVFVNRGRTRVQGVAFNDTRAGFIGNDISLLAPHLLVNRVKDMVFRPGTQFDRAPRIFVITDELEVRTCTYAEAEEVIAWSRISFAEGFQPRAIATSPDDFFALLKCPKDDTYVLSILDIDNPEFYVMDLAQQYTLTNGVAALSDIHQESTVAVLDGSRFLGFFDTTTELDIGDSDFNDDVVIGITYASKLDMLPVVITGSGSRGGTLNRKQRLVRVLVGVEEAYELSVNDEPLFGTVAVNDVTGFAKRQGTYERRFFGWEEQPRTEITATGLYRAKLRSVSREVQV